jgi:hypothetical protein
MSIFYIVYGCIHTIAHSWVVRRQKDLQTLKYLLFVPVQKEFTAP